MSATKKQTNWKEIETDFRAGSMSNREIARWYGVTEGAVRKRAKAENWVRTGTQDADCVPVEQLIAEHVPPSAASAMSDLGDIVGAGRGLAERLLGELDAVTTHRGELEDMIEQFTAADRDGRRRAAMLRAIALPTRAAVLKSVAGAIKTLGEVKQSGSPEQAGSEASAPGAKPDEDDGWAGLLPN